MQTPPILFRNTLASWKERSSYHDNIYGIGKTTHIIFRNTLASRKERSWYHDNIYGIGKTTHIVFRNTLASRKESSWYNSKISGMGKTTHIVLEMGLRPGRKVLGTMIMFPEWVKQLLLSLKWACVSDGKFTIISQNG
jgi:hypothetical protein